MDWEREFIKLEKYQREGVNNDFYHMFDLKYIKDLAFIYNDKLKELRDYDCEYYETHNQKNCPKTKRQIYLLNMELQFLDKVIEVRTNGKY